MFKRIRKDGREIWIEAVFGAGPRRRTARPIKVRQGRYDITEAELERRRARASLGAIDQVAGLHRVRPRRPGARRPTRTSCARWATSSTRSSASTTACSSSRRYRASADYQQFWGEARTRRGRRASIQRIGKGGQEVWIQAIYAPVIDETGRRVKVVKIATDVTAEVQGHQHAAPGGRGDAAGRDRRARPVTCRSAFRWKARAARSPTCARAASNHLGDRRRAALARSRDCRASACFAGAVGQADDLHRSAIAARRRARRVRRRSQRRRQLPGCEKLRRPSSTRCAPRPTR